MASQLSKGQNGPKSGLTKFTPLLELPSIFAARHGKLSMFALPLRSGDVCVISPVKGTTEQVRESLSAIGSVRFIFAPNYYHNLGLKEYSAAYPDAQLIAPVPSIPRLQEVTGLSFSAPGELVKALPESMALLETDGLKTGEIWVRVQGENNAAWIVVDAFCGPDVYGSSDGPELLKPFPTYGLKDKSRYLSWLQEQVSRDKPDTIIPCHGRAVQRVDLAERLIELVTERL